MTRRRMLRKLSPGRSAAGAKAGEAQSPRGDGSGMPRRHANRECHRAPSRPAGHSPRSLLRAAPPGAEESDRSSACEADESPRSARRDNQPARLSLAADTGAVDAPAHERRCEARLRSECHAETRHTLAGARVNQNSGDATNHKRAARAAIALSISSGRSIPETSNSATTENTDSAQTGAPQGHEPESDGLTRGQFASG